LEEKRGREEEEKRVVSEWDGPRWNSAVTPDAMDYHH